jgi:hypothetical protein
MPASQSCHWRPQPRNRPITAPRNRPPSPGDYFLLMYTCRTGQIVRFTSDGNFLPMWNFPGLEPEVGQDRARPRLMLGCVSCS